MDTIALDRSDESVADAGVDGMIDAVASHDEGCPCPAEDGTPARAGDKPIGRPRCRLTQRAILDAAADLLETVRYRDISIERIAAEAGVGKQTIYRWYDGKAELMLEAYLARVTDAVQQVETGDPVADLRA